VNASSATLSDQTLSFAPNRTAVVGGGMLGMALALRLAERGDRVTLFEAAREFGGLAAPWTIGDIVWDRHYHVTLYSDRYLRQLIAELGLESDMQWTTTGTGFYSGGKFHPMNNAVDFLRFPPLGLIDKLRLGLTIVRASRIADPIPLEDVPIEKWLRSNSGSKTFETIWRPLLIAKLGDRYKQASAAFIWAIIVRLYAARRAGLGSERFGYLRGGYARLIAALLAKLEAQGVSLRPDTAVTSVTSDGAESVVTLGTGERLTFDRTVVTLAAPLAATTVPGLSADERERLSGKLYGGIVCASLVLDEPLGPYYVTNLTDAGLPFSAVIDMGCVVDRAEWNGAALVYLPKYVAPDDPLFASTDDAIETSFLTALERMYPNFSRSKVRAFRVSRVRNVFPIATLGYSRSLPPIATSVGGTYLLNSSHIVNGTLNVNETLGLVERGLAALGAERPAVTP
jgi:protoporphyrinogen oxidase